MSSANGKRRLTASQLRALASDTYYGDQVLLSDINRVVGLVETKFDERHERRRRRLRQMPG